LSIVFSQARTFSQTGSRSTEDLFIIFVFWSEMDSDRSNSKVQQTLRGLSSLNLNALRVLFRSGLGPALAYVRDTHHLYSGYGIPWKYNKLPWRPNFRIETVPVQKLFPAIDFTRSPEILHLMPRDLGVMPHELMILAHLIRHFRPERVVEFGTAEGRTALNIAYNLPAESEMVTVNLPPAPGEGEVGYFYWDHPVRTKIKQIFSDVGQWDSTEYSASAEIVFCDACDRQPCLRNEAAQAFAVVKPGGMILRHDYFTAEGPTLFWNEIAQEVPVRHIEDTALLCIQAEQPEVYSKMQHMLQSGWFGTPRTRVEPVVERVRPSNPNR
jgi:predicted O-methyltransferase YrrM